MAKAPIQQQETLSLRPSGLYTYPNVFTEVPKGALLEAQNVVIDRPHVIEQRRGVSNVGTALSADINKIFSFQNRLIISVGTTLQYDSDGAFTWTTYSGSYSAPTNALRIHSFLANKNIYFTTSTGLKKLDLLTNPIVASGAPQGLDGNGSTTGSGWFTSHTQVAYRIVWSYTDSNNNLILGAPSQRIVVANNTGGATNVSLNFTIPSGLSTSWQYQVYRSPMSADLNTEPNDECALVYTGTLSGGDLAAGTITLTDNVPDSLRGETIYTASSQQGILQANTQAPIATDATYFKGFSMLANTTGKQQIFLTLVSVGSPNLQIGDTVTIAGTTYTAAVAENIGAQQFLLYTGGTPSQNITTTANSLVRVINRQSLTPTVYAYYVSGYSDLPGRILIQENGIGGGTYTAASSRTGAFVPDIGVSTLTSNTNTDFCGLNAISISKFQQPEAYPTTNVVRAGAADKAILRIIALRDYVLIFKEDGVFQIVGTDLNSFAVQEVDKTTILQGIETAVSLNNKVFCFTNQTVISMSFNEGATLKSLSIKKDLLVISSPLYPAFNTASYGISYESDNKYILFTVSNKADTTATQAFVYNYITDSWTNWQLPITTASGIVNPADNKLYFGSSDTSSRYVYQERKNYDETDFADNAYAVTITGASGTTVNLSDTSTAKAGYSLVQNSRKSIITAVVDATTITVEDILPWTNAAATVYKPIDVIIKFVPEPCGNPGLIKHFKEAHAIFLTADFASFDLGFFTDFYPSVNFATLVPKNSTGYGLGPWGDSPWGSGAPEQQVIRGIVPLQQRRGHWLNIQVDYSQALSNFSLEGFAIFYSTTSQRFR